MRWRKRRPFARRSPRGILQTPCSRPCEPSSTTTNRSCAATLPDAIRILIELDREVVFHDEHLENPSRVFVDLPGTVAAAPLKDQTLWFDGDGDLVHQIRIGRHPNNTTRVVLDTQGVSSYSI